MPANERVAQRAFTENAASCHALCFRYLPVYIPDVLGAPISFADRQLFQDRKAIVLFQMRHRGRCQCQRAGCYQPAHEYDPDDRSFSQGYNSFLRVSIATWRLPFHVSRRLPNY